MPHPLDFIPNVARKKIFWAFLIWTLILFAIFRVLNVPLTTSAAPGGIVSFELAGTPQQAHVQLYSWDETASLYAAFGLGLDYLFMPSYALTLSLAALLAAGRHRGWFRSLGMVMGWAVLVAALFDAVENFALWKVLLGDVFSNWPTVAAICATFKFVLLALGIVYALVGWLWPKKANA